MSVPTPAARARMAHPYLLCDGSLTSQSIPGFGVDRRFKFQVFTEQAAWPPSSD